MTVEDILKNRKLSRQSRYANAFAKIIKNRMPDLTAILNTFGWKNPTYTLSEWYSTNTLPPKQEKWNTILPIKDMVGHKGASSKIFEAARKDNLKLEIRNNIELQSFINEVSPKNMTPQLIIRSISVEIVLMLGNREVLRFDRSDGSSNMGKKLNEVAALTRQKDQWKNKNIFITNRINGMSIRSFVYTKNKLSGKQPSLDNIVVSLQGGHKFKNFAEFIVYLTGNRLSHYGGSQKRLFKEDKWAITEKKLRELAFNTAVKKHMKQFAGNIVGSNELVVLNSKNPSSHKYKQEFILLEKKLAYTIKINNRLHRKPKRTIITREEKVSDKEKGDWKASFPVLEMEINKIRVEIWANEKFLDGGWGNLVAIVEFNDERFFSRLESNNFFNNEINVIGSFNRKNLPWDSSSNEQESNSRSATLGSRWWYKKYMDLQAGRISETEFNHGGKTEERREANEGWRKKLRRKQFPTDAIFLLVEGKYTLYTYVDLQHKLKKFGGGHNG